VGKKMNTRAGTNIGCYFTVLPVMAHTEMGKKYPGIAKNQTHNIRGKAFHKPDFLQPYFSTMLVN
jgi:hypothetical protein